MCVCLRHMHENHHEEMFTDDHVRPYSPASNDKCQAAICQCDRNAAHCFAQAQYNPENKNLDQKEHCAN